MLLLTSLSLLLSLTSSVSTKNVPAPAHLGEISILAADDLTSIYNTSKPSAALLLSSPGSLEAAYTACKALSETLWSPHTEDFDSGLNGSLAYEVYSGRVPSNQLFWVAQASGASASYHARPCQATDVNGELHEVGCHHQLPVLCTQSAPASNITFADTSPHFRIAQAVGGQTLVGYRDFLTFRFMGVRFAEEPARFSYSSLYERASGINDALTPAPECLQAPNNGSTDCLFLNVWTTRLPSRKQPAKQQLKPVMVYIYGGGFTSGSASNPTNDGGNLAARGDVVVVDIAYRLSTLGFLTLNDGVHNGNYWLSDCIAGLQWVQEYITDLGGDPDRVTIFGESAGAETVQALLASPKAKGLFRGAIMQSNYYEPYIPISTSVNESTIPILEETGCAAAQDQLACLQAYNATALINLQTISNAPVIDGTFLMSSYINLTDNSNINSVPVMMGVNRDEGGVLGPLFDTTNLTTGIVDLAAADGLNATAILDSGAFPLGGGHGCDGQNCSFDTALNQTLRVFNTTTRIYTDNSFHCANEFTAYAGVKMGALPNIWYFEFNRTYQDPAYNTNGVCGAPITATHPFGDPSLEYFKCHAGDLAVTFGNFARVGFPQRDEFDKPYTQTVVDYWTAFARDLDPNPDEGYLNVRGYWDTLSQIRFAAPWGPVNASIPAMMELQWNATMIPFPDERQCDVLGYPSDFLLV